MNDIIICDKGKVTFANAGIWHLQDDNWFSEPRSAAQWREDCENELQRLCQSHHWIDVWSLPGDISLPYDKRITRVGQWCISRIDETCDDGRGVRQLVIFTHFDGRVISETPTYMRGADDRLVKLAPGMKEYDDAWGFDDEGWLFYLEDVPRIWNNLYQRRLINAVADELLGLSLTMDWQGRLARLIRRLMGEGNYDDAMQVAACASARFEHEEWPGDNRFAVVHKQMMKVLVTNEL
jgi:hypothetical protein